MFEQDEVIAMFIPEAQPIGSDDCGSQVATILVRSADGQMSLQPIDPDNTLGQQALTTGAFRKGKPIYDPVSRQIMGYEMEQVANPMAIMRTQLAVAV